MKIRSLEIRIVALPLRERFEISSGAREDRRILLVALEGEAHTGWGEVVAAEDPSYSYETTETAWHVIRDFLAPVIVGGTFTGPEEMMAAAGWVRGHRMARAGIEMAGWDLRAREAGVSLAEAIGGERRPVPVGVSVGLQPSDDALLAKVEGYLSAGYRRVKLKIKPGRDVEMLRRVRDRFPEAALMADANSAYTLDDLPRLREMDDLGLMMVEQPLSHEDVRDHARLQAELRTPVCLDESIRSEADARLALELGACRIINIKPGRVGGFGPARAIHDLCREAGVPVWCGGMLESGVGRAHNVALASLPGFTLPGDISESRRYWERDLVEPEFVMENGTLTLPEGPGMGVTPCRERIDALTVRREVFR
ncbi:MAG: o-succinylbenzoate synthase [Longimicrobiales bacterium]|nr:o-succinylbenzoate synthase [Longimicrobiales bacterium]